MADHVIGVHREDDLDRCFAGCEQLLAVGVVGVEGLEVRLQRLELGFALFPMGRVAAGQHGRNHNDVAGIEVGSRDLSLKLRIPQIVPTIEFDVLDQIGAIADRVDVGPAAEMIGADARFIREILDVRNLAEVELLKQAVVDVKPADV